MKTDVSGTITCAYGNCRAVFVPRPRQRYCSRDCKERARRQRQGWPHAGRSRGVCSHPLYSTWTGMLQRCTGPGAVNYRYYGALGVTVCSRWREPNGDGFRNFVADVGERPRAGMSIDRIDPTGDYEPSNCRWATQREQNLNRRAAAPGGP
jgi:hypothetical protein